MMATRELKRDVLCRLKSVHRNFSAFSMAEGRKSIIEKLWRAFFSYPSQWWDNRHEKANPRYPDFKHKKTQHALWLMDSLKPPWVETELAAMAPGTVQVDLVTWNKKLARYVQAGQYEKTIQLFQQMQGLGMNPNMYTFVPVLNACSRLRALREGRLVHAQIIRGGCESDTYVVNSLIDMYAKCGSIEDARRLFMTMPTRSVVAWSVLILGYVKGGEGQKALELYHKMQQEGVQPNPVTFVGVLNACANVVALEEGRRVHKQVIQSRCESNIFVGNSLVDMYAKCGSVEDARRVFNKMPMRNVVTWSSMILAYVKFGEGQKALELFQQMHDEGVVPNPFTFVGVLNACSCVAALEVGRGVHKQIIQRGYESDIFVASSLVDMYAKCGSIEDAWTVFRQMATRNLVSWNTMLGGYAMHGHAKEAIAHFEGMRLEGVEINGVTFVSLLSACSHGGLVDEGLHFFESMPTVYNVCPTVEHYACIIDLLGRAGRLHEAEDLMKTIAGETNVDAWRSLLGACRVHGNVEMGEQVAKRVLQLDPGNSSGYVLLSNIYAAAGKWDSSENVQRERLERGVEKLPGRTWIEVNNEVHSFIVADNEHPQILQIHQELERLLEQIKVAGYIPDTRFVLRDLDEESKEIRLCHHSEKLAVAFGIISTPPGTPLHIFKNLRVCGDCHTAIKFITKVAGRAITVRDGNRFHHFQDGLCSCREYW